MRKFYSRTASIVIVTLIYLFAIAIGLLTFNKAYASMPEIWAMLLADVVATIIVWLYGIVFANVSVYDPYWSVAPPVMFTLWAVYKGSCTLPVVLLLLAVWYWGVWLMYASLHGIDFLVLAPVAMTALFLFISVPMMERRQLENKPGYADYRKHTRMLI